MSNPNPCYVPLRTYSQYSILRSLLSPQDIAQFAADQGMPAIGLSDAGTLSGSVAFYRACTALKVHPLIGCELYLAPQSRRDKKPLLNLPNYTSIRLFAQNEEGYRNLCYLSSIGYTEGFYHVPRIDEELLSKHTQGLICVAGSVNSLIGYWLLQDIPTGCKKIELLQTLFGDRLYLEISRPSIHKVQESWLQDQIHAYVQKHQTLEAELRKWEGQVPLIATSESRILHHNQLKTLEIQRNVLSKEPLVLVERDQSGHPTNVVPNPKRHLFLSQDLTLKAALDMATLFSDEPIWLSNTVALARRCAFEFDFSQTHFPSYITPGMEQPNEEASVAYIRKKTREAIPLRYTEEKQQLLNTEDPLRKIQERLDFELDVLISRGLVNYVLVVHDFIHWAKRQGIPVGPGRGSAVGSIVLYLLGVTDIEPLHLGLVFERFINPERPGMPDVDVDLCMDRRNEVMNYVTQRYGTPNVAQIITFGTMKEKMALRDVGRVLHIPLKVVNQFAEQVNEQHGIDECIVQLPTETTPLNQEMKQWLHQAQALRHTLRNTGVHAAGIVISQDPVTETVPVCTAREASMSVTQFSMKDVESLGLLKMDLLGLKSLTSIAMCAEFVEHNYGKKIVWNQLTPNDPAVFALLNRGHTLGVFQFESEGMRDLIVRMQVSEFTHLVAVTALYRPGPMEMIPTFISRMHGKEPIEEDHPDIVDILKETYGVMVYQEQVMQIAHTFAGYSFSEADMFRRAMGKKDRAEMERQRNRFIEGAVKRNVERSIAETIFEKIERFASYGFNKSHAAAYAYMSYVTAYFKTHYPKEWFASLMTCDRRDTSKLSKWMNEAKAMQIAILPPDLNESGTTFTPVREGIRFSLSGIRGVGSSIVESILQERQAHGPFRSPYDLFQRVPCCTRKDALIFIEVGVFDSLGWGRNALRGKLDRFYDLARAEHKDKEKGFASLFSLADRMEGEDPHQSIKDASSGTSTEQKLEQALTQALAERDLLGFFLSVHPLSLLTERRKKIFETIEDQVPVPCTSLGKILETPEEAACCFLLIEEVELKKTKKQGALFAKLLVSDEQTQVHIPLWPRAYQAIIAHLSRQNTGDQDMLQQPEEGKELKSGMVVFALILSEQRENQVSLQCGWLCPLEDVLPWEFSFIQQINDIVEKQEAQMVKSASTPAQQEDVIEVRCPCVECKLSCLVKAKELMEMNPGSSKVQILFHDPGGAPLAQLTTSACFDGSNTEAIEQLRYLLNPQLEAH